MSHSIAWKMACLKYRKQQIHKGFTLVILTGPIPRFKVFTNKLVIWIDQNLESPFYLTSKQIYVFGEKIAVQLVLFSGNIAKFQRAKERFTEKSLDI